MRSLETERQHDEAESGSGVRRARGSKRAGPTEQARASPAVLEPRGQRGKDSVEDGVNEPQGCKESWLARGKTKHLNNVQRRGSRSARTLETMPLGNISGAWTVCSS